MTEVTTPTAKINYRVEEKIGLPNFSNIVYGLSITRDVEDDGLESVLESAKELSEAMESFMGDEREKILEIIQGETSVTS